MDFDAIVSTTEVFLKKYFVDTLKFSYVWAFSKDSQKIFLKVALAYFIGFLLLMGGIALPVFGTALLASSLPSGAVLALILGIVLAVLGIGILGYYGVLPIFNALNVRGYPQMDWTIPSFINFVLLKILSSIYAMLSVLNRRLWPLAAAEVLMLIAFLYAVFVMRPGAAAMLGLVFLFFFLSIPYLLLVVYNNTRQLAAAPIFLQGGKGKRQALEESWNLTRGKALPVFITDYGINFIWNTLVQVLMQMLQFFLMPLIWVGMLLGFLAPVVLYAFIIILLIVGSLLMAAFSAAFNFIMAFVLVGVYDGLVKYEKEKAGSALPGVARKSTDLKTLRPKRR
ncbi:MAG: hypothetical protein Q7T16_01740 [Candidatus Burarchaeum sp.]|nr:hypothetical protein [Candidatus Burarchaeum sp.]MDO8339357.1 hypothetical protein [Candidatus Burarchaeum sp.]